MPITVPRAMGTREKWIFRCNNVNILETIARCARPRDQLDDQYRGFAN